MEVHMDVYQVLKDDHREVEKMFEQLSGGGPAHDRQALFAHSRAEEKKFYSSIDHDEAKDLIDEAKREHQEVETLLMEMSSLDVSSPEWTHKLNTLRHNVEHHVQEEESEIFAQAQDMLSDEEADNMGEEVEEEEEKILQH